MLGKRTRSGQSAFSWAGRSAPLFNMYASGLRTFGLLGDGRQGGNAEAWQPLGTFADWDTAVNGNSTGAGVRQGKLYTWGFNANGQTALNINTGATVFPTQVGTDSDWFAVEVAASSNAALKGAGELWTWGFNGNAATARGASSTTTFVPLRVGTFTDATAISRPSNAWGAMIRDGGKLFTWGTNALYATGQNTNSGNTNTPTEVPGGFSDWAAVDTGLSFGLAIRDVDPYTGGGKLYSWGTNTDGRTGQGTTSVQTQVPTQVGSDEDWVDIAASYSNAHALGLKTDGSLYSWGLGNAGQLGLNSTTSQSTPQEVTTAPSNITAIAAAANFSMLISDGRLFACGNNTTGQWGTPITETNVLVFTQVSPESDWVDIRCANSSSMARKRQKVT